MLQDQGTPGLNARGNGRVPMRRSAWRPGSKQGVCREADDTAKRITLILLQLQRRARCPVVALLRQLEQYCGREGGR